VSAPETGTPELAAPAAPGGGWRARDHTRGHLAGSLFVLAVPLVAGSLAQAGFQLVELGFLARLGEEPMAAVIIANQSVRQMVLMLVLGGSLFAVFLRSLQGAGDVVVPMAISLAGAFLVAVPLALLLTRGAGLGPTGVWIASLASSAFGTAALGTWLATGRWARRAAH